VMRMKVGVNRKEATDQDGSVGATCEVEVEIPSNASDEEVLRIRDHWLGLCEATVDQELNRLRNGAADSAPKLAAVARPKPEFSQAARRDDRATTPSRGRHDSADNNGHRDDDRHAPTDGRQLLGWAANQDPDAKGLVISFGKKKGYPPKIVDWDEEEVRAAYQYAKGQQRR
jgi:hypothetical protein